MSLLRLCYSLIAQKESEGSRKCPPEGSDEGTMHLQNVLYDRDLDCQQGKNLCSSLYSSEDEEKGPPNPSKKCSTGSCDQSVGRVNKLSTSYKKHKKAKTVGHINKRKKENHDKSEPSSKKQKAVVQVQIPASVRNPYINNVSKRKKDNHDEYERPNKKQKAAVKVQRPASVHKPYIINASKQKKDNQEESEPPNKKHKTAAKVQIQSAPSANETVPRAVGYNGNGDFIFSSMAEQIGDEIQDASAKRYMVEAGPDPYPVNDRTWLHMLESARANQ